jgi:hypothetical protein
MPRYSLETIAVVLLVIWLFTAVIIPVGTWLVHLLLVAVLAAVALRLLEDRSPPP